MTQAERAALAQEGAALASSLDVSATTFYDDLRTLQAVVVSMQAGPAAQAIAFSLDDKEASAQSLIAYLQNGISALPASLAVYEANTVLDLATAIGSPHLVNEAMNYIAKNGLPNAMADSTRLAAYEELASRGVQHGIKAEVIMAKYEEAKKAMRNPVDEVTDAATAAFKAWNDEMGALQSELMAKYRALRDRYNESGSQDDFDQKERVVADLAAFRDNYGAEFDRRKAEVEAIRKAESAKRASAVDESVRAEGEAILAAVMAASPVTEQQATDWAEQQQVDDATLKKLKRLGYTRDAIYRDMADFYRLSGGKCSAIRLSSDGSRRANAVGIGTRLGEKVVNVGTRFNRTVLFHELAHHLENDPIAMAGANGFLAKRRESEQLHSLRKMTGQKYGADEKAYKDSWLNEYIGKYYGSGVTEVFSMGVEFLSNPRDAAFFAARDPEMFALISGYLSQPLTPAMAAKLNMHGSAMEAKQEQDQAMAASALDALETLANTVSLSTDNWWQEQVDSGSWLASALRNYEFVRGKEPTYIGSHGEYRVFQGVFRNSVTSRNAKGHLVVELRPNHTPSAAAVHDGILSARALIALTKRDRESGMNTHIGSIKRSYLGGVTGKSESIKRLVSAAESIKGQAT